jgi:hypothetical protein
MQTLIKPEILSEEVKKDLDTTTTATVAVIDAKTNPPDILESVREANKVSPLFFFEDRLIMPDEGRLHVKLLNHIHR